MRWRQKSHGRIGRGCWMNLWRGDQTLRRARASPPRGIASDDIVRDRNRHMATQSLCNLCAACLGLTEARSAGGEIDAADRGNVIHKALEKFIRDHMDALPPDALEKLLAIGRTLFAAYNEHPEVKAFWWPRFERIAAWFVKHETERREEGIHPLAVESAGKSRLAILS